MNQCVIPNRTARTLLLAAVLLLMLLVNAGGASSPDAEPSTRVIELVNRGVGRMGQYQYGQAVEAFKAALQVEPGLTAAKINLAIARFNRNRKADHDLEAAHELLDQVLQKEPENVRALYFLGVIFLHSGQTEAAKPCFNKVVQKMPADGAAWYLLGICKQRLGEPGESEFLRAVQCRPQLFSAWYKLSQIALRSGQEEQAKHYLDQFTRLRQSPLGEAIELPQYDQMGELALVRPLDTKTARRPADSRFRLGAMQTLFEPANASVWGQGAKTSSNSEPGSPLLGGFAAADFNRDGWTDLILATGIGADPSPLLLLLGCPGGAFRDATAGSGLVTVRNALCCAVGDYDNDGAPDLFVACAGGNHLFKGKGDGTFVEVTPQSGTGGGDVVSRFAMFLDADHDGDLDILVCNAGRLEGCDPTSNQLLRNNGDGTFTDIAAEAGLACQGSSCVYAQTGDLNGDGAADLLIFCEAQPARVFLNDLFGKFHELKQPRLAIFGDQGAVLQDFDGDGQLDLLVLGANAPASNRKAAGHDKREKQDLSSAALRLFLGDGHGRFQSSDSFDKVTRAAGSWGKLRGLRVADVDLDGALDIVVFADELHLLLNNGRGHFALQSVRQSLNKSRQLVAAELLDLTGDFVPDLLCLACGATNRLSLLVGEVSPPPSGLSLRLTGIRSRDGRTRSPASGYGARLTQRVGSWEQTLLFTGLWGGPNQSALPIVLGLNRAPRADYLNLLWPDGVNQIESELPAGQVHTVPENQRKTSSCPMLFAWNGRRFEFVTDFAGVGGLGYFSAPGVSAPPQVLEHVKIEPSQLYLRNGAYELRVAEPMEETAYIDQLELLAIDHPAGRAVFPEEHLTIAGPPATHQLLAVAQPIFPIRAFGPARDDCAERIQRVDRLYAYEPPLHPHYIGFCRSHTLELDFGNRLSALSQDERVFLFIQGSIEFPYSQTVFAAGQSRIAWEPIRIERRGSAGRWETIVPDGGAPGGTARMMTVDLSGKVNGSTRKLRLTSNLEIFYDQIFIAPDAGLAQVRIQPVPLMDAELRPVGFPREYSPDGRPPWIYDYEGMEPTAPFHVLRGGYTRYGEVNELLKAFDDKYVLVGPGDEVALRFDASSLAATPAGMQRSFVLISHAWCKDMDLYTATPQTVEPLPFRNMSCYPYPPTEHYPDSEEHRAFLKTYNTRILR